MQHILSRYMIIVIQIKKTLFYKKLFNGIKIKKTGIFMENSFTNYYF